METILVVFHGVTKSADAGAAQAERDESLHIFVFYLHSLQ